MTGGTAILRKAASGAGIRVIAAFLSALVLSACTPPIESRVALSEPGDSQLDRRLIGIWSASQQISEWGHWYVRMAPGEEPETLGVLLTVVHDEAKPHWFYAAAHPSEVAGARFLNFRRLAGYGDDYTLLEPGTCRLAHPDQKPGYIIARWELLDDDTLQLYFLGQDPTRDAESVWYQELAQRLAEHGIGVRRIPAERDVLWADSRSVLDASRDVLLNLITEETPKALFNRPILQLKENDGPVATLSRLSDEAVFKAPAPPGSARFKALASVMKRQIAVGDLGAATTSAKALLVAAACFDSATRIGTIKAKELLQAAGQEAGSSAAEIDAVLGDEQMLWQMLGVALLRVRLGDRKGGTKLLLQIIARDLAIEPLRGADPSYYAQSQTRGLLHDIFRELLESPLWHDARADAAEVIERAKRIRSNDVDALLFFAELQTELGFGNAAVKSTLQDAAEATANMSMLVKVGHAQLDAGDIAGAKATFDAAKNQLGSSASLAALGKAQAAADDREGALLTLDRAAAVASLEEWRRLKREAELRIGANDLGEAIELLGRAAGIPDPTDPHRRTLRARAMLGQGNAEDALQQLAEAEKEIRIIERENLKMVSEGYLASGNMTAAAAVARRIESNRYNIHDVIDLQIRANDREAAVDSIARYRELRSRKDTSLRETLLRIAEWQAALTDVGALDATLREISELSADEVFCASSFASDMERLGEVGAAELVRAFARRAVEASLSDAAADPKDIVDCISVLYELPELDSFELLESGPAPSDWERLSSDADWLAALADRLRDDGPATPAVNFLWNAVSMMYADADRPALAAEALGMTRLGAELSDQVKSIAFDSFIPAMAHAFVAAAQSRAGDLPGARETLDRLEDLPLETVGLLLTDQSGARLVAAYYIAAAIRSRGEAALARESLARLSTLKGKFQPSVFTVSAVIGLEYALGNPVTGRALARELAEQILRIPDLDERLEIFLEMADIQIEMKDPAGASATLLRAYETAAQIPVFSK